MKRNKLQNHQGIRIDRIPISGAAGLFFVVASLAVFLALPVVREFLLIALAGGIPTAGALYYSHNQTHW